MKTLEEVCQAAVETLGVIDGWLGHVNTRESAMDSMWQLAQMLKQAGYEYDWRNALEWRGATMKELNDAGFFKNAADGCFHYDPMADKVKPYRIYGDAQGPTLKEFVEGAVRTWKEVPSVGGEMTSNSDYYSLLPPKDQDVDQMMAGFDAVEQALRGARESSTVAINSFVRRAWDAVNAKQDEIVKLREVIALQAQEGMQAQKKILQMQALVKATEWHLRASGQPWEWRAVVEGGVMPANEVPVLAVVEEECGRRYVVRAGYVARFTIPDNGDFDGDADYDPDGFDGEDMYWWPEGWYEWNHGGDTHYMIDGTVTHWAPLPGLPEVVS